jgi:membrane protein YqaA with SNARE-associated domain
MEVEAKSGHAEAIEEEVIVDDILRTARRFHWRLEYTLLIGVGLLLTLFAIGFFYFSTDISNLESYGYLGLFLINLIGSASILLPSPAAASVIGGAAFLPDVAGIPAWIVIGVVAGLAEAIGEFSGYAAGYGGRIVVEDKPQYLRMQGWMERRGMFTMFAMSTIPNPIFDIAGLAAGAVRMPMRRFFLSVWAGKTVKNLWLAGLATAGVSFVSTIA